MIIQAGIVKIVFNKYRATEDLAREMLNLTEIELMQLSPESGEQKQLKRNFSQHQQSHQQ
jgi:deoxycytidylate deaminase